VLRSVLKSVSSYGPKGRTCRSRSRRRRRVSFQPAVKVQEFSRCLGGGGGVPMDGTTVALGLGDLARVLEEPLGAEGAMPGADVQVDPEAEPFSSTTARWRVRVLKSSMGASYYNEQVKTHRLELQSLHNERLRTNSSSLDFRMQPTSAEKAYERAKRLSEWLANGGDEGDFFDEDSEPEALESESGAGDSAGDESPEIDVDAPAPASASRPKRKRASSASATARRSPGRRTPAAGGPKRTLRRRPRLQLKRKPAVSSASRTSASEERRGMVEKVLSRTQNKWGRESWAFHFPKQGRLNFNLKQNTLRGRRRWKGEDQVRSKCFSVAKRGWKCALKLAVAWCTSTRKK